MNKDYLKSFIIGSSFPSFIIFFIAVSYFLLYEKTGLMNYHRYSILAPLGIGLMSLFAKYIHLNYNMKLKDTYLIISLISAFFISSFITTIQTYNFEIRSRRGIIQYLLIFTGHLLVYNKIIYPLDVYL